MAFLSATVWVFSLPIFHGMHLIVPTHPYFFLAVCYPSRIFPPKELERQPQNRLFPLPTARPYPLLSLTHDPPLLVLAGYRLVMSRPCACNISMYVQNLSAAHAFAVVWRLVCAFYCSSLTSYDVNFFLISHSLQLASFQGLGLIWLWAFLPTAILFCFFHSLVTISAMLLYYSCCNDIWPKFFGPLWACCLFFS